MLLGATRASHARKEERNPPAQRVLAAAPPACTEHPVGAQPPLSPGCSHPLQSWAQKGPGLFALSSLQDEVQQVHLPRASGQRVPDTAGSPHTATNN